MTVSSKKKYSRKTVYVDDLTFLGDRTADCTWIQRHFRHHRLKLKLKKADSVVAGNARTADDLVRYYFVPRSKITVTDN